MTPTLSTARNRKNPTGETARKSPRLNGAPPGQRPTVKARPFDLRLTLTPAGDTTTLDAGADITFTLITSVAPTNLAPADLAPDNIHLNDTPILRG
ncbi:hypothetical protein ACFU9F_36230 [Streptomyces zhihengii]|uniref:hypothetical protein n=1 Tax=Streptomyces zhihengii TaxID=1818004 RepID=UPI0036BEAD09